jgi:tetratricopeptide (TPR) repeat protein
MVLKREGPILADLVRNTKPEDELRAVAPVALAEEVLEDVGVQAPLAKQDPEELKRIWAELDLDAKAILVAQRKRGMLASAVGVALLVAVLVVFFQDIVTGARRILGAEDEERVLNIAAEQRGGGRRGDQGAEVDLAAARKAALDQLANKDLPGLGSDEANIQGDLGPRVPATQGLEAGVDKGALARKMEQALGGADRSGGRPANPNEPVSLRLGAAAAAAAAAGGATGSVGAPGLAPSGSPAAGGQGAAQALGQAAPAGSSGDQGGASPAPKPKGKSAEELSREAMNEDDFELARMAMDFGKKQMKRGQYQLAVENFKNARRMGWHQQTVDGLIADCQRLEKEMEGALAQGQALMRQKRWKDAIPHLKRAQKLGDDSNTTNNLIMECEDYLQQADKAAQGGAVVQ